MKQEDIYVLICSLFNQNGNTFDCFLIKPLLMFCILSVYSLLSLAPDEKGVRKQDGRVGLVGAAAT